MINSISQQRQEVLQKCKLPIWRYSITKYVGLLNGSGHQSIHRHTLMSFKCSFHYSSGIMFWTLMRRNFLFYFAFKNPSLESLVKKNASVQKIFIKKFRSSTYWKLYCRFLDSGSLWTVLRVRTISSTRHTYNSHSKTYFFRLSIGIRQLGYRNWPSQKSFLHEVSKCICIFFRREDHDSLHGYLEHLIRPVYFQLCKKLFVQTFFLKGLSYS